MKHFEYIKDREIFFKEPEEFNLNSEKDLLCHSLGATLYMPAIRPELFKDIKNTLASSVVICLEDSIPEQQLETAENNIVKLFQQLEVDKRLLHKLPLLFIRIRNKEQLKRILDRSKLKGLCGFVIPKFTANSGEALLELIDNFNHINKRKLYVMPIIETPEVIYKETRAEALINIKTVLDKHKELVLNVRIGGTDFSGIYGIRRSGKNTIYELKVICDVITDIINVFKRADYVISAPVNEYFNEENSTLIEETILDKANGLLGKTAIHPKQVNVINSLLAVTKEEYQDACDIVSSEKRGALKSKYSNKMNEVGPHLKWAKETLLRARTMGVLEDGRDYKTLL